MGEEPLFPPKTATVSGEAPVLSDNPVAGNDDDDRIPMVGSSDGPGRPLVSHDPGDILIGRRKAEWDTEKSLPNTHLKIRPSKIKLELKGPAAPFEILIKL